MKNIHLKRNITILVAIIGIVMATLLIFMALFAQPVADQYAFINGVRDNGVVNYTASMYQTWSGRLIQVLGIGIAYRIFGYMGAQIIAPIILFVMLALAYSWLAYLLFSFKKDKKLLLSAVFGLVLSASTLYTTSCLFDIYLWLDAAFVYLLGIFAIVFDTALFIWLIKYTKFAKSHKILTAALLIVAFLCQSAGETSMILTTGWSFVAMVATFVVAKWKPYRRPATIIFITLLLGALVLILSPGLWARSATSTHMLSYFEIFVTSPIHAYIRLFKEINIWQVALVIILSVGTGLYIKNKVTKKTIILTAIGSILIFLSTSYIAFVASFCGSNSVASRVFAVPDMGLLLSAILFLSVLFAFFFQKYGQKNFFKIGTYIAIFVCLIVSSLGFLRFNKGYFIALITRSNALAAREASIKEYQQGDRSTKLDIYDAPIMIDRSDATDFTYNGWGAPVWFYESFLGYYGLSPDEVTVHGEKIITGENIPDWYQESGTAYCTVGTSVILERYWCANNHK